MFFSSNKQANNLLVRLGEHDFTAVSDSRIEIPTSAIYQHDNYQNVAGQPNDLAVLELSSTVMFGAYIQPICLPPANLVLDGMTVYAAGWGRTSPKQNDPSRLSSKVLLEVDLTVRTFAGCRTIYDSLTDKQFCAGASEGGKDTCKVTRLLLHVIFSFPPSRRLYLIFNHRFVVVLVVVLVVVAGRFRWSTDVRVANG